MSTQDVGTVGWPGYSIQERLACVFMRPGFLAACAHDKDIAGVIPGHLPREGCGASLLPSAQRARPPSCFPTSSAWRRSKGSATAAG